MLNHRKYFLGRIIAFVVCLTATIACSSSARGQELMDLSELVKEVKPSVARVQSLDEKGKPRGHGSGFIVDSSGIICTNYHVIEGAKGITISFPGDPSKGEFKSAGYIAIYPKKDMALIKIEPKDKKLRALPLADKVPSQGEAVVAFGAPLGYNDTVTDGIISAVRTGKELTAMMSGGGRDGYGKDGLGYELNTTWLQTNAPISPGNSGGPLVNTKGEVVGMNSFVSTRGQNLNFSLSIKHVIKFIADSGKNVQDYANLPEPREKHGGGGMGDPKKTLALWKGLNRAKNELNTTIERCEQKFRKLSHVDPRNPRKGMNLRNKRITQGFKRMSDAYKDYSSAVSKLEHKDCDPEVIQLIVIDTVVAKQVSKMCTDVANSSSSGGGTINWEAAVSGVKSAVDDTDTQRELIRVTLGLKYNMTFPTEDETADEDEKAEKEGKSTTSTSGNPERSKMRLWTDSTGKFKINAKCIGIESGKVKLEKADGAVLEVPLDKLSESDKRFLASTG